MQVTVRRWFVKGATVLVGILGLAIWWTYARPPLEVDGVSRGYDMNRLQIMGLDLANNGRWPVHLSDVTVEGESSAYQVEALVSLSGEIASSAAVSAIVRAGEGRPQPRTGPVPGWKIEPTRLGELRPLHGLRLTWDQDTSPPQRIIIRYRYLVLPIKLIVDKNRWQWQ
jgi:hypothetical protein